MTGYTSFGAVKRAGFALRFSARSKGSTLSRIGCGPKGQRVLPDVHGEMEISWCTTESGGSKGDGMTFDLSCGDALRARAEPIACIARAISFASLLHVRLDSVSPADSVYGQHNPGKFYEV